MEKRLEYIVREEEAPCCVQQFLQKRANLSRHEIRSAKFRKDGILVNGRRARVTQELTAGDRVQVLLEQKEEGSRHLKGEKGCVDILYEDEDLVFVNKPPGLPVHPGHGHYSDTLANYLVYHYRQQEVEIGVRAVGRLDKDTSGVVIFAKNRAAAARLAGSREYGMQHSICEEDGNAGERRIFEESENARQCGICEESGNAGQRRNGKESDGAARHRAWKEYLALVEGYLPEMEGTVEAPVAVKVGTLNQMEVSARGRRAVTHYRVLKEYPETEAYTAGYSLLSLRLETGRTHQIRVHMASIGHPLLGDAVYGKHADSGEIADDDSFAARRLAGGRSFAAAGESANARKNADNREGLARKKIERAALHCYCVELIHPFTGKIIRVTAPVPEDMKQLTELEVSGKEELDGTFEL